MKKHVHLLLLVMLSQFIHFSIQAQCPGCIINLPPLGEDTVWLSNIPDAEAGMYYAEDMSFRLPKTTTPVNATNPNTPAGLTISQITITSLGNLPPGIQWTASQTVFQTANETDGCIRLCGTPLVADTFEIVVNIEAIVFGFPQNTSFTVDMVVNPAMSISDGFSMTNNIGCGSTTVEFTNLVPSNGASGFSYQWNFGNGMTSTLENPAPVTYDQPGVYVVSYEANVDTAAYFLTAVTVTDVACDDFFGDAPDMSIKVNKPDGSELFDTPIFFNTDPPITHNGFYEMTDGQYYMEVIDDDFSGDDVCGIITFNKFSNGTITVGEMTVVLNIAHQTSTVIATDTVIVYEQPAAPIVSGSEPDFDFCEFSSMTLTSSYSNNIQWYQDGTPLTGFTEDTLEVTEAGLYQVTYTSADGCVASSEEVSVSITPAPAVPAFINDNNLLTLSDPDELPASYALQWYQDGNILPGETGLEYCISALGSYTLLVTDLVTGCINSFTQTVPFIAGVGCDAVGTTHPLTAYDIRLSPNPTSGRMELTMHAAEAGHVIIRIHAVEGQLIYTEGSGFGQGAFRKEIDLTGVAEGLYFVELDVDGKIWTERVVVLGL
jgi:Secretion system C-terminal sorting domain/PKD domain